MHGMPRLLLGRRSCVSCMRAMGTPGTSSPRREARQRVVDGGEAAGNERGRGDGVPRRFGGGVRNRERETRERRL
jgi:hypothetical protein